MTPIHIRAMELERNSKAELREVLTQFYAMSIPRSMSKYSLVSMLLSREGYAWKEIENRGPIALTKLLKLR